MIKSDILNQISQFSKLEKNWDGYGGVETAESICKIATDFINIQNSECIDSITDIFPNPNGTLTIEWRNKELISALEIGENNYSFFTRYPNQNQKPTLINGDNLMNEIQSILNFLEKYKS